MKPMKPWMGLAAAVLLTTGCGSETASESACGLIEDATNEAAKRIAACFGGGATADAQFDVAACTAALDRCSDADAKRVGEFYDCAMDAFTCEAMEGANDENSDYYATLEGCFERYTPSQACLTSLDGVDFGPGVNAAAREAMMLRAVR